MGKHYTEEMKASVIKMREEGKTYREIGQIYERSSEQIRELVRRHRRNEAKRSAGIIPQPKGRPRSRALTKKQEMELKIKRLEQEVALYQSFLQAVGRM